MLFMVGKMFQTIGITYSSHIKTTRAFRELHWQDDISLYSYEIVIFNHVECSINVIKKLVIGHMTKFYG